MFTTKPAPEIIDHRPYRGEPTDVWSAGILMYALLIGEFPFQHPSMTGLFEQIKSSPVRIISIIFCICSIASLSTHFIQQQSSLANTVTLDNLFYIVPIPKLSKHGRNRPSKENAQP